MVRLRVRVFARVCVCVCVCARVCRWEGRFASQEGTRGFAHPPLSSSSPHLPSRSAWNGPAYNGTAEDVHFAIEWGRFREWVADVKAVFEKDLWGGERLDAGRCMGPGYMWLRFGHPRSEYLHMGARIRRGGRGEGCGSRGVEGWGLGWVEVGLWLEPLAIGEHRLRVSTQPPPHTARHAPPAHGMARPVYVQSTWLRSRGSVEAPMRFGWVPDLIEELTLCK